MLATPPPSRLPSARKVSAAAPASSSSATAPVRTVSIECEARRRPSARPSAGTDLGRGMTAIQPDLAELSNSVLYYRTTFGNRTLSDRSHHDHHRASTRL